MAINRVDHAAIRVADLDRALDWYERIIGMTVLDRTPERVHLACQGERADLTLLAGGQGLVSFAFGADGRGDLNGLEARLSDRGIPFERIIEPDRPGTGELIRFALPSEQTIEVAVSANGVPAGITDYTWDGRSHTPTDIDHVNLLGVEDPKVLGEFLRDVLGFRLTQALAVGDAWVAMWVRSSVRDHDLAYMRAVRETDRLHHVAFTMIDGNHYWALADRLAQADRRFEFGPGRHGGGGPGQISGYGTNLFAYAFDPTGNRNEFSGDMKEYPDDEPMVTIQAPPDLGKVMNLWADNMPESFMTVGT